METNLNMAVAYLNTDGNHAHESPLLRQHGTENEFQSLEVHHFVVVVVCSFLVLFCFVFNFVVGLKNFLFETK